MFLSMVAAPTDRKGEEVRIGALTKESDKRRFNVAASRARDQVWLFHTATLNDLNPQDMRAKLLSYYLNPQHSIISEPDWSRCGSDFERDVGRQIYSRGYRIIPQYEPFGSTGYRIDLLSKEPRIGLQLSVMEITGMDPSNLNTICGDNAS